MTTTDAFKAAGWTFVFSFVVLFGAGAVGFLTDVLSWASSEGTQDFPPITSLGYLLVAALMSALIGLVNFVVRWAQAKGVVGGQGPSYTTSE